MKFIKVFADDAAYKAYRDSGDGYIKPNVSLSRGTKKVFYNYPIWDTNDKPFVDLDLPSGTLWAAMNVGASKPSEAGLYFQWGDISGYTASQVGTGDGQKKFSSDWSGYKWGVYPNFTKYTTTGATLDLEDDAAHINLGGDWHMPTPEQIQELIDYTTTAWTTSNGASGMTFTSKKDKSKLIFIPAAGGADNGSIGANGTAGSVWSSVLSTDNAIYGQGLGFFSVSASLYSSNRFGGLSVRGVVG